MSIRLMSLIWENGPQRQSDRFVLLALADYANDAGECWPGIAGICRKTCLSERGVQTAIRRLQDEGWIDVEIGGGRKKANLYRIKTPQEVHPAGGAGLSITPQMDVETPQMDAQNPAGGAPEPSITTKEPSKSNAREILTSILSEEIADDFLSHRRAIKAPVTPQAAKALVKKCTGHPDPDAVFMESIANGWRGVFPDRTKPKTGNLVKWEEL